MSDNYYLVGGSESLLGLDVSSVQRAFAAKIQRFLPNNQVVWVSLPTVRAGLLEIVKNLREALPDVYIVTLSDLYFPYAEASISCNRVVDLDGANLGLAHRPGSPSLRSQIDAVMQSAGARQIAVVDDTLFHGHTISTLRGMGMRVDVAVEYFVDSRTKSEFESQGTPVYCATSLSGYLDVMPLHDFLPPMPLCGKVVGQLSATGEIHLLQHPDGGSISMPYLIPFIDAEQVSSWASIPLAHVHEFSVFALSQAIHVAVKARECGFANMTEALRHSLRVSWPYMNGFSDRDMSPEEPVETMLRRAYHQAMLV